MPTDPALSLLGRSENRLPQQPGADILETFPNRNPERHYSIHLSAPEFSSICPVTGQPDSAHLEIYYIPAERCVETKSLKFYLASFRNHPSFNEQIVNRILDDLVQVCAPAGGGAGEIWGARRHPAHLRGAVP